MNLIGRMMVKFHLDGSISLARVNRRPIEVYLLSYIGTMIAYEWTMSRGHSENVVSGER